MTLKRQTATPYTVLIGGKKTLILQDPTREWIDEVRALLRKKKGKKTDE